MGVTTRKGRQDLKDRWALVTGASSGLGVDFAHLLAMRGANLILVARTASPMRDLAAKLQQAYGIHTQVMPMDLTQKGAVATLRSKLDARGIAPDLLINNAGFGIAGDFVDVPVERSLKLLQLNIVALTELTHAFANDMAARGNGQILLLGSLASFHPLPTYAAYAASKAYVLSFGEALHQELKAHGVTVTVLCPGPTATNFFQAAGDTEETVPAAMMMASRDVAKIGLDALHAGRPSVVPGLSNTLSAQSARVMPRGLIPRLAYRFLSR